MPDEQTILEEAVEAFGELDVAASREGMDAVVDRAVENRPLEATPREAASALVRLQEHFGPSSFGLDGSSDFAHVRNGARRLYLRAAEASVAGVSTSEQTHVQASVWSEPPLSNHDACRSVLNDVMDACALRFDGYRYRHDIHRRVDGRRYLDEVKAELEAGAPLERYSPFDKCAVFFLTQRYLGRSGGRSAKTHPSRRIFRELFVDTYNIRLGRKWALEASICYYYHWRWAARPVAEPYLEMAREDLERIDYEYA